MIGPFRLTAGIEEEKRLRREISPSRGGPEVTVQSQFLCGSAALRFNRAQQPMLCPKRLLETDRQIAARAMARDS